MSAHPLSGANMKTLADVMGRAGGVPPRHLLKALGIAGAVAGRYPFTLAERFYVANRLPELEEMAPPVFILGHWRSGTTHLYNIMAKAGFGFVPPVATGLPWDMMLIGRAFRPLLERALPEERFIDAIPVKPDSPQEDEIALANMTPVSFYHGIYFPERLERFVGEGIFFDGLDEAEIARWQETFLYFLRKLSLQQEGRPLLIKNPVYTARLSMLAALLPGAKFIHIHRNPYDIFVSMRNFYDKLLKEFALQDYDLAEVDGVILSTYARMMDAYAADAASVDPVRLVEVSYDALDSDALGTVRAIYGKLELDGFGSAEPVFEDYITSVRSYRKNRYAYADEAAEKVETHWGGFLERWGYGRPGAA